MFLLFMSMWAAAIAVLIGFAVYRAKAKAKAKPPDEVRTRSHDRTPAVVDKPTGAADHRHVSELIVKFRPDYHSRKVATNQWVYAKALRAAMDAAMNKDDFEFFILNKYLEALDKAGGKVSLRPSNEKTSGEAVVRAYLMMISKRPGQAERGSGLIIKR